MESKSLNGNLTRLAVCAAAAAAVVCAAEALCRGKSYPLWETCGPWIEENKLQAIAVLALVLYGASLALPAARCAQQVPQPEQEQFTPCA